MKPPYKLKKFYNCKYYSFGIPTFGIAEHCIYKVEQLKKKGTKPEKMSPLEVTCKDVKHCKAFEDKPK